MAVELIVRYPAKGRRVSVRTDLDWEKEHVAASVSKDGDEVTFRVETKEPYFEFKVVLTEADGKPWWSVGSNYFVQSAVAGAIEVFPHFFTSEKGRVTDVIEVPASDGGEPYRVRAYAPASYDENPLKRFPVVYMHDGTNLFFPEEAFAGQTWNVHACLDQLESINAVDPVIVIGIQARERMEEYTAPGYVAYGDFLAKTLKPLVDQRARALPGSRNSMILGSSLGGVVALHTALAHPEAFGLVACLSSTFGFQDDLFQRVAKEPKKKLGIYLDSGWPKDNSDKTMAMRDALLRRGYQWGSELLHLVFPGDTHSEESWATRLHIPMQLFFRRSLEVT